MKKVFLKLMSTVFFILPISLLLISCGEDDIAIDVQEAKSEIKTSLVQQGGIYFKDGKNEVVGMGLFGSDGSVTNNDFFDIIDTWTYYENTDASKVDVYIDMSSGVNEGIEKSQEHMESLTLTLKNNATYYKVGGSDNDTGIYKPEPLNITDYTKAYDTFTNRKFFNDGRSKLRAGLQACVGNEENITVFVTDFLLDEGVNKKKPQDLYSNITYPRYEDGTPWAITEFEDWFEGNNILEIVSVEHTLKKGYGCHKENGCSKQIYYMFFTPAKLVGMNSLVDDMIIEMSKKEKTNYIKIDPLAFGVTNNYQNNLENAVGDVDYNYKASKRHSAVTIGDYKVQFIEFNIPMMKTSIEDQDAFTVFNDLTLINNLEKIDRRNKSSSPYSINLAASFYDVTEIYYQLGAIDKLMLSSYNMSFDPNKYPGNLSDQGEGNIQILGVRDNQLSSSSILDHNQNQNSIKMLSNTLQTSAWWANDKDHGKLYLCDIIIDDIDFEDFEKEYLKWTFYDKSGGYLENISLAKSLDRALYSNKNNYIGKVIYSYLIALNDNK